MNEKGVLILVVCVGVLAIVGIGLGGYAVSQVNSQSNLENRLATQEAVLTNFTLSNQVPVRTLTGGTYAVTGRASAYNTPATPNAGDVTVDAVWNSGTTLGTGECTLNVYNIGGVEYGVHEYKPLASDTPAISINVNRLLSVTLSRCTLTDGDLIQLQTLTAQRNRLLDGTRFEPTRGILPRGTFQGQRAECDSGAGCVLTYYWHTDACGGASNAVCNTFDAGFTWNMAQSLYVLHQFGLTPDSLQ